MWLKKECCAFLLINVLLPKKVAKLISSKIFRYLEAQDNRSNKTKFCQSTKISYSCKIFMFLSIIYKLLFMHYFCIVGGPSMTQGNTPSLQRENHTHTHTHTTTTLFMTIPIKSHISKTIDSKNLLRASQNTKSNQE